MISDIPVWWHGCGIVLVCALFMLHRSARSAHILVTCIIRLPGVVLHELAHLLTGLLLRAQPVGFSLLPKQRCDGRWTLGSVAFRRVTAFNAVPIALAPLGLLPSAYFIYISWYRWLPLTLTNTLFLYGAVFLLVANALPSRQDITVACNWKSLILYGSIGILVGYVWLNRPLPLP
ncbi:MAG: hypothetical protein HXX17_14195 [Geobacteraceae bacterium]|nr:hypothetical protein [Geobacteraceae bacterium]